MLEIVDIRDATEEEMKAVLKKVNLLGFLQTQDGLQTKLLEKASNLSGVFGCLAPRVIEIRGNRNHRLAHAMTQVGFCGFL